MLTAEAHLGGCLIDACPEMRPLLRAALAAATAELPVVGDSAALEDAQMLLEACVAADITSWALALGLVIEDIQTLAGRCHRCCRSDEVVGVHTV